MIRTASYVVMEYWHESQRNGKLVSLDAPMGDDGAIELDAWVDGRTWLAGCPRRLVQIAHKKVNVEALDDADRKYVQRARPRILYNFGREEQVDKEGLRRLVRSIGRFLGPEEELKAGGGARRPTGLLYLKSWHLGGAWVLDQLWRELGI